MRTIVLYTTDWHAGFSRGVLAPGTMLPGESKPKQLEQAQDIIWNVTQNVISYTERRAKDAPIFIIHGGDVVHGHNFVEEMTSGKPSCQTVIALAYLEEFIKRLNISGFHIVSGTDVHTDQGSGEELVSMAVRDKFNIESVAASQMLISINGVMLDVSHEGPVVGRSWLYGNAARAYLRRVMSEDLDSLNKSPADLYLRAHVHGFCDVSESIERMGKFWNGRLIVCPPMCGSNGYVRWITRGQAFYRLGMIFIEIIDGVITFVKPLLQTFDVRTLVTANGGVVAHPYKNAVRQQRTKETTDA